MKRRLINIRIGEELYEKISLIKNKKGISMNHIINNGILMYIQKYNKEGIEEFIGKNKKHNNF